MQIARSRVFDVLLGLWTLSISPAIPVLMRLRRPDLTRRVIRFWTDGIFGLSRWFLGLRLREEGVGNKHLHAPCLYVSNHQSAWETLAFNRLLPDVTIIAKQELGRIPVFGWFLRNAPMILIDREAGARALKAMVAQSQHELAQGRSILIFPEGTRVKVGDQRKFQPGLVALYRKLDLPVVPVAHNSGSFWGRPAKRGGTITVSYLPAIPPGLPAADFMARIEALVNAEKDRLSASCADRS